MAVLRDAAADGVGIGYNAFSRLLQRHDALESSLGLLLETQRKGQTIPEPMWDHVACLLRKAEP